MKLNGISTVLAGLLLSLSFHFFRKKTNSSRIKAIGNPNHTATTSIIRPLSQNYEVFLNFRGTDTRKTFTDHLYYRLRDVRVCVFRDNEELYVGEEIHPNLLAAIQASKISIPIISSDYASSKWCLLELVQILKCRENSGQIVVPIFYHVDPSDVRHQKGSFEKAFSRHKKNHGNEIVQEWKDALKKVASLKAFELNNNVDGFEGKLINQVVEKVLADLRKTTMVVPEFLVGVEEQAKKIMKRIDEKSSNDVQVVLIHGMGGIGKTTLGKFLYNQLTNHFQFCSFLESVSKTSIPQLQKQLISNTLKKEWPCDIYSPNEGTLIINGTFKGTKVLLVLDDVDNGDQLNALMGRYDCFGHGSIIIITSRNRDVVKPQHAKLIYELRELDSDQSFQLFCKHAFQGEDSGCDELKTIARDIVSTTGGLPLAIEVIGSFLLGKDLDLWKETSKKLKRVPDDKVQFTLKISYDALKYEEKKIFLDIACLFPYVNDFQYFMYMWDGLEYYPRSGIEVLKSLSLIKVRNGDIEMHDQLRKLGREIIRQEDRDLPGKRSILWNPEEACEVLKSNQGTEHIEVLNLISDKRCEENFFSSEQFEGLPKLRLLRMSDANLVGNFKKCFFNLRWLQWNRCPSNFTATGFHPKSLVVLNLSESDITEYWGGWSQMKYAEKLKVLQLRKCSQLKATPDFSTFRELEILDLSRCTRLKRIHPSICRVAKTLKSLDLQWCEELEELPIEMGMMEELRELYLSGTSIREISMAEGFMTKLETLNLSHCTRLKRIHPSICSVAKTLKSLDLSGCEELEELPIEMGMMEELRVLYLGWTSIREIPVVEGFMTKLESLSACHCKKLAHLPDSIGSLTRLERLSMHGCVSLTIIPESIGKLKSLSHLALSYTNIKELPESIGNLCNLKSLKISGTPIKRIPAVIGKLKVLRSFHADGLHGLTEVPMEIGELTFLETLYLDQSPISGLPTLPGGLRNLSFSGCSMESLPNISNLTNLISLSLRDMDVIPNLPSRLERLSFHGCQTLRTLPSFSSLKSLVNLTLEDCNELMEINALEEVQQLSYLEITNCRKISKLSGVGNSLSHLSLTSCDGLKCLPDLSTLKYLTVFRVVKCNNVVEIQGLGTIKSLRELQIYDCSSLERIGDFSHLTKLRHLRFGNCPKLRQIDYPCLEKFPSLVSLCLYGGGSAALKLPDLLKFNNLKGLGVNNFDDLREIPKLQELKSLSHLSICGCRSLENLPDFSEFTNLLYLNAQGCEKLTEITFLHCIFLDADHLNNYRCCEKRKSSNRRRNFRCDIGCGFAFSTILLRRETFEQEGQKCTCVHVGN